MERRSRCVPAPCLRLDAMDQRSTPRRPGDPRQNAEAAFKKATTKPVEAAAAAPAAAAVVPNARELVSLRIDRDVLEHFQKVGRGWQEQVNFALRKAAGLA